MKDPFSNGIFRRFIINNRFVLFLVILLLIGINILVFREISFIFTPVEVFFKTVLLPIMMATILYYLLNPIINVLEKYRINRIYSIILLFLLGIGLLIILIISVIPLLREQLISLVESFPEYVVDVEILIKQIIGSQLVNETLERFSIDLPNLINNLSEHLSTRFDNSWVELGLFVGAIKDFVIALIIMPFILFYLLKDGRNIPVYLIKFLPVRFRSQTMILMEEMNKNICLYIQGQIIVSLCIGVLMFIGFNIIGIDYATLLAITASFTSVVPYLGPAIAITPALIIAIVTSPIMLLKLIVVWTIVQVIEGKIISPQIMGHNLNVHPITIIFVILTAGNLFGIVGIVLAVPGYAVLKVISTNLYEWFKIRSGLYTEKEREEHHF